MSRRLIFNFSFGVLILIFILNTAAFNWSLYWRWWWFDVIMHTLGGFWVGLSFLWVIHSFITAELLTTPRSLVVFISFTLSAAMAIGFAWELYEHLADTLLAQSLNSPHFRVFQISADDTAGDLAADAVGGLIAGFAGWSIWKRNRAKN
jgi:hypothetical protein